MWQDINSDKKWYALFVKTGCEEIIISNLSKVLGDRLDFFVPKRLLKERKKGKWYSAVRSLFPGYILIHGNLTADDYYIIKETPNVFFLLMNKGEPLCIDEEELAAIKHLMDNSEDDVIGISDIFLEGDNVYVKNGPLHAMEGRIVSINKRKGRAKIRLTLCGRDKLVDLAVNLLTHT